MTACDVPLSTGRCTGPPPQPIMTASTRRKEIFRTLAERLTKFLREHGALSSRGTGEDANPAAQVASSWIGQEPDRGL